MNILEVFEYNQHFVAMMNVINAAKLNPPKSGDKHHIIPRCWFKLNNLVVDNSDENLVLLTKEQHGKVHKLMSLCAKDEQLKKNMVIAAQLMGLPATSLKYTHTDETRKKISEAHKGKHYSNDTRKKMSEAHKGENNPIFGKHRSAEIRKKISEAQKGKIITKETRKKMSEAKRGKINKSLKGNVYRKGKVTSEFGKAFKEHYGVTASEYKKLYMKEYYFYKYYGKFSWEIK